MRRPNGTVCASVMRPYRFYVLLEGNFDDGNYALKVNDRYIHLLSGQTK